ncbi:hypothetical protein [Marinimicrobium sp. ABcell2]|uniref:hypothetical protein n=1 Tax=Marinimicrobium sp. ABcell2 TaxID=3069751 RepID=UPI0027B834F1|nr:hypothetical protein [Marinimicrobium sp. ABcell2]MDQ2077053.1 hypothetical protein [Marinimicrobium sp. ABcell2]
MIKSVDPVMIEEDDFVAVAGRPSNGVLKAYAYKNLTTGVSGNDSATVMFLASLVAIGAGTAVLLVFSESIMDILPNLGGTLFIGVGLTGIYETYKLSTAYRLLKAERMF